MVRTKAKKKMKSEQRNESNESLSAQYVNFKVSRERREIKMGRISIFKKRSETCLRLLRLLC